MECTRYNLVSTTYCVCCDFNHALIASQPTRRAAVDIIKNHSTTTINLITPISLSTKMDPQFTTWEGVRKCEITGYCALMAGWTVLRVEWQCSRRRRRRRRPGVGPTRLPGLHGSQHDGLSCRALWSNCMLHTIKVILRLPFPSSFAYSLGFKFEIKFNYTADQIQIFKSLCFT